MAINKICFGDKLYKVEGDNVEIIRVQKIKADKIIALNDKKEKVAVSNEDLKLFKKLKPDAYINFSIVTLEQNMKDVIVAIHRRSDLENGEQVPYAACRQNIIDIFANQIQVGNIIQIGCCMSKDTCPSNVDFHTMVACNGISKAYLVSAYIDDTLEDLLQFVPNRNFDEVLSSIYGTISNASLTGYCKSLKQLLTDNCFMYDFHKAFGIDEVNFEIKYNEETVELDLDQVDYFRSVYKYEMSRTYVLPYTKEIDLKKIQRDYMLISDSTNKLYLIGYDKGEYNNREYNNIKDKRDVITLVKYMRKNNK